jgi:hypothetical protein
MKWFRLESGDGLPLTSLTGNFNCQLLKDAPALVNYFSQLFGLNYISIYRLNGNKYNAIQIFSI